MTHCISLTHEKNETKLKQTNKERETLTGKRKWYFPSQKSSSCVRQGTHAFGNGNLLHWRRKASWVLMGHMSRRLPEVGSRTEHKSPPRPPSVLSWSRSPEPLVLSLRQFSFSNNQKKNRKNNEDKKKNYSAIEMRIESGHKTSYLFWKDLPLAPRSIF